MFQTVSEQAKSSAGLTTLPEAASTDTNASEVQPAETPDAVKAAETTMSSTEPALVTFLLIKNCIHIKFNNRGKLMIFIIEAWRYSNHIYMYFNNLIMELLKNPRHKYNSLNFLN